ncbi:MAG: beta-propeller fold lactonase family protein [Candidatus Aminicenantes bacterium]|nr:beta-propeller fold lactonase family protein [Candidatus Aminicenantes bacterium]NIM79843.1 beta-propeller fold lactonase family protein [Candidatus Aminicenantes bacterium]NIN19174.1 beta-propeller fold lactonase family protein [Candidatus Aminicenantes bacterium]NIN43078.1 beta-propeller fold lactonase family protein [Candidatus Aminicenantes bacterium]NIN85819.1 beta-propeller fold lactonase family protein [Candidatus Aminicenantes bacterium]
MYRYLKVILPGLIILCSTLLIMVSSPVSAETERFYVGEAVCRRCHHMVGKRDQFNRWYLSKHARSWAALAMPEAREIARLSGIDVNPYDSPVCLKCHTTASDTETWQRDEAFFLEDGIQCEYCHGPGSEYTDAAVMVDREAAIKAGLQMPGEDFCLVCHNAKESHMAVLETETFDYKKFLYRVIHPGRGGDSPGPGESVVSSAQGGQYAGVMVCAGCHKGESKGYVFSKWRLSAHADAYAVLGTKKACQNAGKQFVKGNPQKAAACLRCHATGQGPGIVRGVQCESCHGPGNKHVQEAAGRDPAAAKQTGLVKPTRDTCIRCHTGKNFNYEQMKEKIRHWKPGTSTAKTGTITYKTPFNLTLSPGGKRLFAACESSDSLIVVDTGKRTVLAEIKVQNQPHGVCLSADGKRIFVSNRGSDTISVIDANSYKVLKHIPVGDEPHGLVTGADDNTLYVANAGSNDISVVDLKAGSEVKRLSAGRGAWAVKRSPDGRSVFITNNLSHYVKFRTPSRSEVTVIDTERSVVKNRIMIPGANLVQGIDFSPDGEFALVTLLRTKNLLPITRVIQGWMITNGIGILREDGQVDQLLLDEMDNYFADPTDVVITPDGRYAYVSAGGIDAVAAIDLAKIKNILGRASKEERQRILLNHLGIASEYVVKRIVVGRNPRGLAVSGDGRFVYAADALDDTISVIQVDKQERVAVIDLGGPKEITLERFGERIFHSAEITYGRQFSCHTCHPDGGVDGITYDIEPDGLGVNPVDNRTLRGILDTAPFKWTGKNKTLRRQCGPRLAVFFTRIDPFTPEQVNALERYICTIPRNPNRYRKGHELTAAQRRGKLLFERTHTNSRTEIPKENRCNHCHSGPYFTNRRIVDVGTRSHLDTHGNFDVPHLNNIYETAPYLHDGRADTLEEIWTRFNPDDKHGVTNDMTKDQLNDLIEYLKTL